MPSRVNIPEIELLETNMRTVILQAYEECCSTKKMKAANKIP